MMRSIEGISKVMEISKPPPYCFIYASRPPFILYQDKRNRSCDHLTHVMSRLETQSYLIYIAKERMSTSNALQ